MLNSKKTLTVLLTALLFSTVSFSQWLKPKGKGYYKISAWYLNTNQHYTDSGDIDPNVTRGYFNLNFFGDYGISDNLDIIAYVPFFSRTHRNDVLSGTTGKVIAKGEVFNSIGDIDIGIELKFLKTRKLALSGGIFLGLPTGNSSGGSDKSFQTGDGEFNQLVRVNFGIPFSISEVPFYSKAYLGFNNRTKNYSDEFRLGLETGLNILNNKVWLIGRSDIIKSLKNGSLNAQNNQGNIFANNIEYVSLGGEIAYYISKKFGISFYYAGALSGRIIAANPSYSLGVFLDIK